MTQDNPNQIPLALHAANGPLDMALQNAGNFTPEFLAYLPDNLHVFAAFEREAYKVIARGYKHYSANTIVHVLRHHSALQEVGSPWKLNNNVSPYLSRLFAMLHPAHAHLFEFRIAKAVRLHRKGRVDDMPAEEEPCLV